VSLTGLKTSESTVLNTSCPLVYATGFARWVRLLLLPLLLARLLCP
jgi:hypothetical protein